MSTAVVVELQPPPTPSYLPTTSVLQLLAAPGIILAFFSWFVYSRLPLRSRQHGRKVRLGVDTSNLADAYQHGTHGLDVAEWRVKSLWIFPVKSCRGIEVAEARVVPSGLEHDRQFMFAEQKPNPKTGEQESIFITQRQYPKMALITTEILEEKSETGGTLQIAFPLTSHRLPFLGRTRTIRFPLLAPKELMSKYQLKPIRIWGEQPLAYDISSAARSELRELSAYLGTKGPLALFRVCPEELREVYRNAPTRDEIGYQPVTGFQDAYPLHMLNLSSVRELGSRITNEISRLDIVRFRANIIVSGPAAFEEDHWKQITLGTGLYHAACRTVRCKMPNVDPDTGEKHMQEPDRTMRSYRAIDPGNKFGACLGMQLVPAGDMGILRAGDSVSVLETGAHYYVNQ